MRPHLGPSLGATTLSALLLVTATALACGGASDDASAMDGGTGGDGDGGDGSGSGSGDADGGSGVSGENLYLGVCSSCHGVEAEGTPLGYELRHPPREHAQWVVRNGRPGDEFEGSQMLAYSPEAISDADLQAIFDYLDAFEVPTEGPELYLDYCGNCHGPDAAGGVVGVDIRDKEFNDILEKVRQGIGLGNPGGRTTYMPQWDAATLDDAQVQRIADAIPTL